MELKCPYCPETFINVMKLAPHVHGWHRVNNTLAERLIAIKNAQTIETVTLKGTELANALTDEVQPADAPTQADRDKLSHQLSEVGNKLGVARAEMKMIRQDLDSVDARMKRLDAQLVSPATVRRATLNQVWDRLVDAGHIGAAKVVMDMIRKVVDDQ